MFGKNKKDLRKGKKIKAMHHERVKKRAGTVWFRPGIDLMILHFRKHF